MSSNQGPASFPFAKSCLIIGLLLSSTCATTAWAGTTYYVSTGGDNSNSGRINSPWRTIQFGADQLQPGDTLRVRGGIYKERVSIKVSGSPKNGYTTISNYPGENPVLEGGVVGAQSSVSDPAVFRVVNRSRLRIQGFEIRNFTTSADSITPIGILLSGATHHVQLLNNHIHHIATLAEDGNAHGILASGTSVTPIHELLIKNNHLHDLKLGSSESIALNGNVENFIVASNKVHHTNNIAIDIIGFEQTAPTVALDQARHGIVWQNSIHHVDSINNPVYNGDRSADGIYVDGGRNILINGNTVSYSNVGIELASEHKNRKTTRVTAKNNLLFNNHGPGISLGGYDAMRGGTENCELANNTLFNNDTDMGGSGELSIQFYSAQNKIINNILFSNEQGILISNEQAATSNYSENNLYYSSIGPGNSTWQWSGKTYTGFQSYVSGTGNDTQSKFANPNFADTGSANFRLTSGSPALDMAEPRHGTGGKDKNNMPRFLGEKVDAGAYEFSETGAVTRKQNLAGISSWFYFIDDNLNEQTLVKIINSTYDLVVIDYIPSEKNNTNFPIADVIQRLNNAPHPKKVLAYIDIGQAESYRTYWQEGWGIGNPSWILAGDPDGWDKNYVVAYWNPDYKKIWLGSSGYLNKIVEAGFDGVYLDWVEAYSDSSVKAAAAEAGVNARKEMVKWVGQIASAARATSPGFIVMAQNAAELVSDYNDATANTYLKTIDGIAQEQTWFDGGADGNPPADCPLPRFDYQVDTQSYANSLSPACLKLYTDFPDSTLHVSSQEYLRQLNIAQNKGLPIFTIDYALRPEYREWVYTISRSYGFTPLASTRNLDIYVPPVK